MGGGEDGRLREAQGCGANLRGAPGILGRRAQGEAGGNRGRDRGRALREEEDDPDAWGRPVSGRRARAKRLRAGGVAGLPAGGPG